MRANAFRFVDLVTSCQACAAGLVSVLGSMKNRRSRLLLSLTILEAAACATLTTPPLWRLRGGGDDDDKFEQQLKQQGNVGILKKEELVEKLNQVPVFCIMQADGSVISLPDMDGADGDECCTWFVDSDEAQLTLKKVVAANPDEAGMRLVRHGLGDFIQMSDSWPRRAADATAASGDAPRLKLKGLREVSAAIGPQMIDALKGDGLDVGTWQLGVFMAEELAQADPEGTQILLPIFLSPSDVQAAYEKAGIPATALQRVKVLEIRQLLKMMLEPTPDAVNPWRATQFITVRRSMELAQSLEA